MRSCLVARLLIEDEAAVAIGTVDKALIPDLEVDLGVPERTVAAVTGNAGGVHD
jgi:hypothetical protein